MPPDTDPQSVEEARAVIASWGMGALEFFETKSHGWWAIFPEVAEGMRPYLERPAALTRELGRVGDAFSPDNIVADYQERLWKVLGVVAAALHPFIAPVLLRDILGDEIDEEAVKRILDQEPRRERGENIGDVLARAIEELRRQAERRAA